MSRNGDSGSVEKTSNIQRNIGVHTLPAHPPNMTIPASLRPLLLPAAWLATAALTFCLGRISLFIESRPTLPLPSAAVREKSGGDLDPPAVGVESFLDLAKVPDHGGTTLAEITHGQPIAEWLKRLLAQEDEIMRMTGFLRLLESLTSAEEIQEALGAVLSRDGGSSRSREFRMLLQKWAQLDPADAMKYVQDLKDKNARYDGNRAVLLTWMRQSPQEAIAWAEKNGASPEEREGNWPMSTIVSQLAKNDVDWALRLAEAQGVSRARGRMIESLVPALLAQKGDAGAREIAMNETDQSLHDAMIARLAGRLAASDPQSTAQWVTSLPAGDARTRALTELVGEWSRRDPVAAASFLEKIPPSPETDDSRARLAYNVLRKDPESAIAWAGSMTDPESRTDTVNKLLSSWLRRDGDAAKQWIASSPLPEATKAQLLTTRPTSDGGRSGR